MVLDLVCTMCKHEEHDIFYHGGRNEQKEQAILARPCANCGHTAYQRKLSVISRTPSEWGDTPWDKYDYGLGATIRSKADRDRIMKEKGLRPLDRSEIPS